MKSINTKSFSGISWEKFETLPIKRQIKIIYYKLPCKTRDKENIEEKIEIAKMLKKITLIEYSNCITFMFGIGDNFDDLIGLDNLDINLSEIQFYSIEKIIEIIQSQEVFFNISKNKIITALKFTKSILMSYSQKSFEDCFLFMLGYKKINKVNKKRVEISDNVGELIK